MTDEQPKWQRDVFRRIDARRSIRRLALGVLAAILVAAAIAAFVLWLVQA
jgi:hypothetical protein